MSRRRKHNRNRRGNKKFRKDNKGFCPKCKKQKISLTRHHILPKRWFHCKQICLICRKCHNDLETVILKRELEGSEDKQPVILQKYLYYEILHDFLNTQDPRV